MFARLWVAWQALFPKRRHCERILVRVSANEVSLIFGNGFRVDLEAKPAALLAHAIHVAAVQAGFKPPQQDS